MSFIHRIAAAVFKLFNPKLTLARGAIIDPRAFLARGGAISIGENSAVRAGAMLLPSGGNISIGRRTTINQYVVIYGEGGVTIGNGVMIAALTSMFSGNHRFDRTDIWMRDQGTYSKGGIAIEDDVWVGASCVILDGVKIGKGSVIAAGAVITKNVPPYSIMAGVPGHCIGNRLENAE